MAFWDFRLIFLKEVVVLAGNGPPPKDPSRRARRNKDASPMRIVEVSEVEQPRLEDIYGDENPATGEPWSFATLRLWDEIGEFARVQLLQDAQWSLFARAMVLDDAVNRGDLRSASEARLQIAKFGIAPDDLARMRIQLAQADEADEKRRSSRSGADVRGRYKSLKAVD